MKDFTVLIHRMNKDQGLIHHIITKLSAI